MPTITVEGPPIEELERKRQLVKDITEAADGQVCPPVQLAAGEGFRAELRLPDECIRHQVFRRAHNGARTAFSPRIGTQPITSKSAPLDIEKVKRQLA